MCLSSNLEEFLFLNAHHHCPSYCREIVTENRKRMLVKNAGYFYCTGFSFSWKTVTTLLTSVLLAFVDHLLELYFYIEFLFKRILPACVWRMLFKWETAVPLQALEAKPAWSSQEQNKGTQNLCHRWVFV